MGFFFFGYIYSLKLSMTMKISKIDRTSIAWNKKEERTREREKIEEWRKDQIELCKKKITMKISNSYELNKVV